ncbi:hypothetical protein [Leifsonia shinshuensis]|uniref:Uncharacterized protein n=1 Tax=Leifsonia shinshuensis TaxID=150026 RepID=A0A853CXG2_9MICO|nr:hypothetical protein [Leifsonia shinshuensis]NYJ25806.1 hypothetical protein [Leifsonia shinshuensis]
MAEYLQPPKRAKMPKLAKAEKYRCGLIGAVWPRHRKGAAGDNEAGENLGSEECS